MGLHLPSSAVDLALKRGDHRDRRAHGGRVGGGDAGGWASCSARSAAWICSALASTSRRRARFSAAVICAATAWPPRSGSGASPSSSSASAAARSSKASSAAGKYSRSAERSRSSCRVPFPDQGLVRPGDDLDRLGQVGVPGHRTQLVARRCAPCRPARARRRRRSWPRTCRAAPGTGPTCRGLIANTVYPAATSAVTHGPRSVSIPTSTCSGSASSPARASAISSCSRAIPATPSGSRALRQPPARSRPAPPHRGDLQPSRHRRTTPATSHCRRSCTSAAAGDHQRPNGPVLTPRARRARHPISGPASRPPAGARSDR